MSAPNTFQKFKFIPSRSQIRFSSSDKSKGGYLPFLIGLEDEFEAASSTPESLLEAETRLLLGT